MIDESLTVSRFQIEQYRLPWLAHRIHRQRLFPISAHETRSENESKGTLIPTIKDTTLKHQYHGIMGSLKFLKKIRDKLDNYIEDREQARERRSSFNQPHPRSWSPDHNEEERKRRKSYDESSRRPIHTHLNNHKIVMAEKLDRKISNGEGPNRGRKSEGNLPGPRRSRDVAITPGDGGRARSPRRSDSVLVRKRQENQRGTNHPREDRPRASNEQVNRPRERFPPVPPIPPQWTKEARNNTSLSPRAKNQLGQRGNPQTEEYERLQREFMAKKAQKQSTVDWDAMLREKNEQVRLAAEIKRRDEEQKWKGAEQRRRAEEQAVAAPRKLEEDQQKKQEAVRQREREAAEKTRQEARERETIRQLKRDIGQRAMEQQHASKTRETERQLEQLKTEKRRKAEEAEEKVNADRVKRENEARRLRAFGPLHQRRPTWPNSPATAGKRLERNGTDPVRRRPTGNSGQQPSRQEPRVPVRRNSESNTPQRKDSVQNKLPVLAALTEENLRAQAVDSDDSDIDPLGRGLGDNMRTFLHGFAVPTILQSDLTSSIEDEEVENKDKKKYKPNK